MDNEYTRKGKVCPLIGNYCNEEHKDCDRCVAEEDAWQRVQCYIDCHNYDWTFERIKHDYQKYYLNTCYCSHTLMDIIENNKNDCEMLFGLERQMLDETRLEGLALLADQDAINALIETQVIFQLLVKKNLVSAEEVALTREIVKRQPKYKQIQQTLDDAMDRVDESSKFEELMEKSLRPNGREQLTKEEKDYLLGKLDQISKGK